MSVEGSDLRRRELAAIHLGAKALGLDRDVYEDMLFSIARVRSARDLDSGARKRVLDHLRSRGFKSKRAGRPTPASDRIPMIAKIRMILAEAGRVDAYADGIAQKMFGVERYEWLPPDQMHKLVSALVYDQRRRAAKEPA